MTNRDMPRLHLLLAFVFFFPIGFEMLIRKYRYPQGAYLGTELLVLAGLTFFWGVALLIAETPDGFLFFTGGSILSLIAFLWKPRVKQLAAACQCRNCGAVNKLTTHTKFCEYCGASLQLHR